MLNDPKFPADGRERVEGILEVFLRVRGRHDRAQPCLVARHRREADALREYAALKQRIILTTPSTLMALLKVIAYGWRQTRVSENAREIRELGQDLHKRLNVFVGHLQKIGRSLGNAVESFNSAVGSMERNVLPQARKFPELGATTDSPIEPVDPIETAVRSLAAAAPSLESEILSATEPPESGNPS